MATPNGELGGALLADLPLIVVLGGVVLSLIAAFLTEHLVRRRTQAEALATENRRMYPEQRSIAEILQRALLPQDLPEISGVETSARYVAGSKDADVGGDWYDVIPLDGNRFLFVVGDVSGHGVEAATLMARLHFSIRAFASHGDSPVEILNKLGPLLNLERESIVRDGSLRGGERQGTLDHLGERRASSLAGAQRIARSISRDCRVPTGRYRRGYGVSIHDVPGARRVNCPCLHRWSRRTARRGNRRQGSRG